MSGESLLALSDMRSLGLSSHAYQKKKLKALGTTRQLHLYVRELIKLEKHISWALHFVDRLGLDGLNRSRHVVGCEDSAGLHRYLRGAISAVVVHP